MAEGFKLVIKAVLLRPQWYMGEERFVAMMSSLTGCLSLDSSARTERSQEIDRLRMKRFVASIEPRKKGELEAFWLPRVQSR